jgi:signal transduction histidine kinase
MVESTTAALASHADEPDCVVALFGSEPEAARTTIEHYRACGGEGAIVLVVDDPAAIDDAWVAHVGISRVLALHTLHATLLPALHGIFATLPPTASPARDLTRYLGQCHALLAAGLAVTRLPHRLNNPLAALLAEAELLRLEPLSTDQRESVDRILEISHRLIAEVRQLEGMTGPPA